MAERITIQLRNLHPSLFHSIRPPPPSYLQGLPPSPRHPVTLSFSCISSTARLLTIKRSEKAEIILKEVCSSKDSREQQNYRLFLVPNLQQHTNPPLFAPFLPSPLGRCTPIRKPNPELEPHCWPHRLSWTYIRRSPIERSATLV